MLLGGFECWHCAERFFTREDRRSHCEQSHPRPQAAFELGRRAWSVPFEGPTTRGA